MNLRTNDHPRRPDRPTDTRSERSPDPAVSAPGAAHWPTQQMLRT